MSEITTQPLVERRRRDAVVWPDPSPLTEWWDSVMDPESGDPDNSAAGHRGVVPSLTAHSG